MAPTTTTATIELAIDRIVMHASGPLSDPGQARRLLDEALAILAEKLAGGPFERWHAHGPLVVDSIELGVSGDTLFGPEGAHRLAEALYEQLVRRLS